MGASISPSLVVDPLPPRLSPVSPLLLPSSWRGCRGAYWGRSWRHLIPRLCSRIQRDRSDRIWCSCSRPQFGRMRRLRWWLPLSQQRSLLPHRLLEGCLPHWQRWIPGRPKDLPVPRSPFPLPPIRSFVGILVDLDELGHLAVSDDGHP